MAEGDDDKEADVSKPKAKRPLDHVPLKIIIKRHRPNVEASVNNAMPPPPAPNCTPKKKAKKNGVVQTPPRSKYNDIAELITALAKEQPDCFQEIWHTVRQQEAEDEDGSDGKRQVQRYLTSNACDFGDNCEMPWLHPAIDVPFWEKHMKEKETSSPAKSENINESCEPDVGQNRKDDEIHAADWRCGPAGYWYDFVPSDCKENCTHEFKLKDQLEECEKKSNVFPDDAFLMVTQLHWEDDVIWKNDDVKLEACVKSFKSDWRKKAENKYSYPTSHYNFEHRLPGYLQAMRGRSIFPNRPMLMKPPYNLPVSTLKEKETDENCYFENEELIRGSWENEIIWDAESMSEIPKPKIPTLDPNDDNIVLGVPEDADHLQDEWSTNDNSNCIKLSHPHIKNSKILISKTGITEVNEEDQAQFALEDPFNVSNDSYYAIKSSETSLRLKPIGKIIQHSIPVLELRPPFIPTHLSILRLQHFHRPPLKRYSHGRLAQSVAHPVFSLTREISIKAQVREEERQASGGGDVFFMREAEDLSGRDGDLVLVEFSEENPLLMNEIGMCSKIINYYKRKASKDEGPPQLRYGEVVYPHTTPFLGVLSQGEYVQAVENNLYRCPIYEHQVRETDFLVIRTRHSFSIREVSALYVAGQQCPLYEVPAPNTKCAHNFTRDFLQVHIFRMFQNCPDRPQWVKMEDIKRAFPDINDLNIRKCLKMCSDFKRVDVMDSNCWVLRPDFRLPSEEEMRSMVTPEQCCAQFSMYASLQRLKDAGYGGNVLFVPPDEEDDDEEGMQLKIDDEIKVAPWNLTRGYIQSLNGKCLLDITGLADPTGCGEGFSYLTRSNKPRKQLVTEEREQVTREKPSLANAKVLLKKMGVSEKEIKRLSPWELIEIARSVSKKKMKGKRALKGPKVRPMTTAEHYAKYKEECQRIFDLQNRVLKSTEELSSDEEEVSEDDGSDVEEMGKILEKLISNGRSYTELRTENEEKEREELVKMMMNENAAKQNLAKEKLKKTEKKHSHSGPQPDRVLKINRTFRDSNGKEYTRVEFVRKSSVIDIYLKIRATKDEAFISQFAALESAQKQKMLREKRNIETQLLRLKQREHILAKQDSNKITSDSSSVDRSGENHIRPADGGSNSFISPPNKKSSNSRLDPKRRCGACGNPGHKKGNKACPQYFGPVNVAMTEEEEEEYQRQMNVDDQNLVNVDGTKLKLSVKLIKRAEEMKKKTLVLRVPKDIVRKRKRPIAEPRLDYLEKYTRPVNRRRVDPLIVLSNAFESILNEMRDLPASDPFHFPVNAKALPHYYTIISRPMDLQTIRENLRKKRYQSRKDFLEDVHQIVQNSSTFNGSESPFTINAAKMLDLCVKRMGEQEEELIRLEETINPDEEEKDQGGVPQNSAIMPSSSLGVVAQPVPKSIVDLAISDSEDEAKVEEGYLDGRVCPVVP